MTFHKLWFEYNKAKIGDMRVCRDSYFYKLRLLSFLNSLYGALDQAVSGLEGDSLFITLAEGK